MIRILTAIAYVTVAMASNGPSSLYSVLNGQTFNPPGYTIVAYQSCMQNQNAGNPCGSFTRYETSNGQYTYQLYGPAPCSGSCCREFRLTLACGATTAMSGVNENPTCVYSATLTLPQVCGIDMTVGNEAASPSSSAPPPTPTSTRTLTASLSATNTATNTGSASDTPASTGTGTSSTTLTLTATPSTTTTLTATPSTTMTLTASPSQSNTAGVTPTPMYIITSFPSTTSTATLSATATPLFMITAWPSTSPINVSATSTPLFMYTAYPSVTANGTTSEIAAIVARLVPPGSSTATILGGVAVGIVGIAAVAYAVNHFRKGGTVGGLINNIKAQKGAITKVANMLPMTEVQKAKLNATIDNPESILPPEAHQAIAIAKNTEVYKQQAIAALPISEAQKATLSNTVQSLQTQAKQRIEQTPIGVQLTSIVGSLTAQAPAQALVQAQVPATQLPSVAQLASAIEQAPVLQLVPAPEPLIVAQPQPASVVPITISTEDLADVQAFLQAKQQAKLESS